jgi:hypothetical protein
MRNTFCSGLPAKKEYPGTEGNQSVKKVLIFLLSAFLTLSGVNIAFASESDRRVPDEGTIEQSTCKELAELGKKYDASKNLPESVVVEGKPCPKGEAAGCLFSVIEKVMEKCERQGPEAVPKEDMDKIARLHDALKEQLIQIPAYWTQRETIEKFLYPPEVPPFEYKVGVKGFLRGEGASNFRLPDLSYNPGHAEGRFLYRVQPYAYWHPTDYLDIHLEGQGYGYTGGSQYLGKYSLYQGYIEGRIPGSDLLALKVGRQEFVYGSAFILGANAFFQGLTFDAARLRVKPVEGLTADLLGGWYATPWSDGLKGNLAGGYASYAIGEGTEIQAYGFNDTGSEEHHPGEYRNTWGLRGTATFGPVYVEIEPVYQSGRTLNSESGANDNINAWGGHADMAAEARFCGIRNTFFASYAYGSGNTDAANGISARREFSNQDTDTSLTGDMSLIGDLSGIDVGDFHASGLQIFNLGWGIDFTDKLNFSAAGRYFYANAVPDGFSRTIGLESDFTLTYAASDVLEVLVGYDHFFTGGFFRDATGSGKDINYGYVLLQFDLSREKPKSTAKSEIKPISKEEITGQRP